MNRSSQHWIVTEVDILKFAVMLMCISGMMQSSVLFVSWSIVYDGLKYMIPVLGALIVMLRIHSVTKLRYIMTTLGNKHFNCSDMYINEGLQLFCSMYNPGSVEENDD